MWESRHSCGEADGFAFHCTIREGKVEGDWKAKYVVVDRGLDEITSYIVSSSLQSLIQKCQSARTSSVREKPGIVPLVRCHFL